MTLFVLAVLVLYFATARYAGRGFHADYVGKDAILSLKGVFILLVLASHFCGYGPKAVAKTLPWAWDASVYAWIQSALGQMVVVPFLFFSGYGVFISLRDKGEGYFAGFPVKRILSVLFRFDLAVLPYLALMICDGKTLDAGRIVGGFTAWSSFGNSNWYIFTILILYALSFLAFLPFRKRDAAARETAALVTLAVLSVAFAAVMAELKKPAVFFNTAFAYLAGAAFAVGKKRFEEVFLSGNGPYALLFVLLAAVFPLAKGGCPELFHYETAAILFSGIVVLLLAKISNRNPLLVFCGRHLFAIYILQRLPMILLKRTAPDWNAYLTFAAVLGSTLLAAWLFDRLAPWLWSPCERMLLALGRSGVRNRNFVKEGEEK